MLLNITFPDRGRHVLRVRPGAGSPSPGGGGVLQVSRVLGEVSREGLSRGFGILS